MTATVARGQTFDFKNRKETFRSQFLDTFNANFKAVGQESAPAEGSLLFRSLKQTAPRTTSSVTNPIAYICPFPLITVISKHTSCSISRLCNQRNETQSKSRCVSPGQRARHNSHRHPPRPRQMRFTENEVSLPVPYQERGPGPALELLYRVTDSHRQTLPGAADCSAARMEH